MLSIGGLFLSVVFLLIIPLFLGYLWCDKLDIPKGFSSMYVFGTFFFWAYSQLILVVMVLKDMSFTVTSIVLLITTIAFLLASFYQYHLNNPFKSNTHFKRFSMADIPRKDRICFGVLAAMVIFIIVQSITLQSTDADDARFVVLAMDSIKSDRLLRINPATGRELTKYFGEVSKDVSSPWTLFMAYVSNLCGIKGTIMIHTILPVFLYLLITCGFWLLSDVFFKGQFSEKCLFVSLVWFVPVFSNYSAYNAETFILMRIWQGKAVVAGVTVPMLLYGMIKIYREFSWQNWANLLVINLGSCLLSGNAIVIGVLMICSYGLVYSLVRRNYKFILYSGLTCVVNFIFYLVNHNANYFL